MENKERIIVACHGERGTRGALVVPCLSNSVAPHLVAANPLFGQFLPLTHLSVSFKSVSRLGTCALHQSRASPWSASFVHFSLLHTLYSQDIFAYLYTKRYIFLDLTPSAVLPDLQRTL